jgi:hypothetical protein
MCIWFGRVYLFPSRVFLTSKINPIIMKKITITLLLSFAAFVFAHAQTLPLLTGVSGVTGPTGTTGATYVTQENGTGDWSDFVFEKGYKLPALSDIEAYISANKHLPDIPSECDAIDKGVDVGEMNKLLLQKVEELTLYLIQQQKEIDALKNK